MRFLQPLTIEIKPGNRSVDPGKTSPLNRLAFATDLAQSVFHGAYAPPSHANLVDRTPAEVGAIRAAMWGGAK